MSSMGLKNSILVLLIILILHFLIKNAIMDKRSRDAPRERTKKEHFIAPVGKHDDDPKANLLAPIPDPKEGKVNIPECPPPPKKLSKDDAKELMEFVYGSEDADGEDIAQYFKGFDVTHEVKAEMADKMSCPIMKTDDNSLPVSTTCDPGLQKISVDDMTKKVKADCNLHQNIPNMMLKEYEDESSMNGGKLYGDLSAYDDSIFSFEEYSCAKTT